MKKILSIIFIFVTITGCDRWDQKLTVFNGGSDTIYFAFPLDGYFKIHPIKIDRGDTLWTHINFIPPNDSIRPLSIEGMSWEKTINKKGKDSALTVFIFDKELLKSAPADSLVLKQLYTKKYIYKVTDLQKLNWRIEIK